MLRISDIDHGWARLRDTLRRNHRGPHVKVGVQGPAAVAAHAHSEKTVVEIGSYHEFGRGVPKRSFIRQTFDMHRPEYVKVMRNAAGRVVLGQITPKVALEAIGQRVTSDMADRIERNAPAPFKELAERTKRRKRSSRPLIDTGQLKGSITYSTGGV